MSEASLDQNPYRTPEAAEDAESGSRGNSLSSKHETLGRVLVTWEKLRFVYNAIGAVPTVIMLAIFPTHAGELLSCALAANLCYCVGPLVDCYLTWFGLRHRAVTAILFVLGTGTMLLLALGVGLSLGFGPFVLPAD